MLAIRRAIETLGPRRVLFGSDYPITQLQGRCVALADSFFWIHPETANRGTTIPKNGQTLVGIESMLCLREACEDAGLNAGDIQDIFCNNALRLLEPHLQSAVVPKPQRGPELWTEARKRVSGGTGLLSKRSASRFASRARRRAGAASPSAATTDGKIGISRPTWPTTSRSTAICSPACSRSASATQWGRGLLGWRDCRPSIS